MRLRGHRATGSVQVDLELAKGLNAKQGSRLRGGGRLNTRQRRWVGGIGQERSLPSPDLENHGRELALKYFSSYSDVWPGFCLAVVGRDRV